MRDFIGRQALVFLATADSWGECDASFHAGPALLPLADDLRLERPVTVRPGPRSAPLGCVPAMHRAFGPHRTTPTRGARRHCQDQQVDVDDDSLTVCPNRTGRPETRPARSAASLLPEAPASSAAANSVKRAKAPPVPGRSLVADFAGRRVYTRPGHDPESNYPLSDTPICVGSLPVTRPCDMSGRMRLRGAPVGAARCARCFCRGARHGTAPVSGPAGRPTPSLPRVRRPFRACVPSETPKERS